MAHRTFLALVTLLAFGIRFAAVVSLRHGDAPPDKRTTGADGVEYNILGLHLAEGFGYTINAGQPTSFRAPGFPFFLAAIYRFFPANYAMVYICLCLMGAISCVFTYYIANQVLTERGARIASILCAVYPPYVYFASCFDSENICAVVLVISIWLFLLYVRKDSTAALVVSGLALGYCALIRPFSIVVMFLLAADVLIHRQRSARQAIGNTLLFVAAFSALVLP